MNTTDNNPLGLNGVEFAEYAAPQKNFFDSIFATYGFKKIAKAKVGEFHLHRQGDINFIVNEQPSTFGAEFAAAHGPSLCSMGFRVKDAKKAFELAVQRGALPYEGSETQKGSTPFPAIYGIGDSLIYFMDPENSHKLYEQIFSAPQDQVKHEGFGFQVVDHFTNNVPVGKMSHWCEFYAKIFGFREVRHFDIRGKATGLISKVMRSPCGLFSIPINEPTDPKSQIQEYLNEYQGSGVQHLALTTQNIVQSLDQTRSQKAEFLSAPPDTYYRTLKDRLPAVTEDINALKPRGILVDGDDKGYLLQIFTKNLIGPIFFELIQRKNHQGFGEGNFQALFDAIEQDQRERGVL
jgi:4-hydroxyphenylpyruvate dioxygenase